MTIDNTAELRGILKESGVSILSYRLHPDIYNPDLCTCIDKQDDNWVVYYHEHGMRQWEKEFDTEQDACEYMHYNLVLLPTLLQRK